MSPCQSSKLLSSPHVLFQGHHTTVRLASLNAFHFHFFFLLPLRLGFFSSYDIVIVALIQDDSPSMVDLLLVGREAVGNGLAVLVLGVLFQTGEKQVS
jgi:hypothetical protein